MTSPIASCPERPFPATVCANDDAARRHKITEEIADSRRVAMVESRLPGPGEMANANILFGAATLSSAENVTANVVLFPPKCRAPSLWHLQGSQIRVLACSCSLKSVFCWYVQSPAPTCSLTVLLPWKSKTEAS